MCHVACGSLNHVFSLFDSVDFVETENIHRRHFHTLTFYYINLKSPPTTISIKNKQKTLPLLLLLHMYKYTDPVYSCMEN